MYGFRSLADVEPRSTRRRETRITKTKTAGPKASGFAAFELHSKLERGLADAGFDAPRPIQAQTLPAALRGRDVLGLAQTGTGKTAAFALPILDALIDDRLPGPRALIVAPTRELASQIQAETARLAKHTHITCVSLFGGVPIARQERSLRQKPDIVVACPGRLLDLIGRRALSLDAVEILVLDEADHMFDMGFLPDVKRILAALPRDRQNLLFSATMPKEIRGLADRVLHKPKVVELVHSKPAETIDHAVHPVDERGKDRVLRDLLAEEGFRSAIVFLRTKRRARNLAQRLQKEGHEAIALQGNMSQPQRERALSGFRDGKYKLLVATDIAARGIDVAGISHVINYDLPNTPDAYVHRIGRTGRSGTEGRAYTLVTPDDAAGLRAIEKRLGKPIDRVAGSGPQHRAHGRQEVTRGHLEAGRRSGPSKGSGVSDGGAPQPRRRRGPKPPARTTANTASSEPRRRRRA